MKSKMPPVQVRLFGRFSAQAVSGRLIEFDSSKAEELFCYLVLNQDRPHHREGLMSLLWNEADKLHSRRYLRKTLWQLQSAVKSRSVENDGPMFLIEPEWVQVNREFSLWTDARSLEDAYNQVQGQRGHQLDASQIRLLQSIVDLYQSDLLEGWYQEWSIFERERFKRIQLLILDKLVDYAEFRKQHERGIHFATKILQHDHARERTHRSLMRLYFSAGDRTTALRQYEKCLAILADELDVLPSRRTKQLYEKIKLDFPGDSQSQQITSFAIGPNGVLFFELLDQLQTMQSSINNIQDLISQLNKPTQ